MIMALLVLSMKKYAYKGQSSLRSGGHLYVPMQYTYRQEHVSPREVKILSISIIISRLLPYMNIILPLPLPGATAV